MDETDVARIAKVCHGANRAYCETLGDYSQPEWEVACDWQKESAMNGVRFYNEHPDADPGASHAAWVAEKMKEGWVYGTFRDTAKKIHPNMVSFDLLPPEQQRKDVLFTAICKALS